MVGKKVQYSVDHATPNREYVTVYLAPSQPGGEPECLNHTVVSEGWASVQNKDAKRAYLKIVLFLLIFLIFYFYEGILFLLLWL